MTARATDSALARASSLGPRAHFDEQKADAGGKPIEIAQGETLAAHEIDQ